MPMFMSLYIPMYMYIIMYFAHIRGFVFLPMPLSVSVSVSLHMHVAMVMKTCEHVYMWTRGYVDVWTCDMWTFGNMDVGNGE
jgi:hypothetical protein